MNDKRFIRIAIAYNVISVVIFFMLDYDDKTGQGLVAFPILLTLPVVIHLGYSVYIFVTSVVRDYKHLVSRLLGIIGINIVLSFVDIFLIVALFYIFHFFH